MPVLIFVCLLLIIRITPTQSQLPEKLRKKWGLYFTKDYLGFYDNKLFGKYKYPEAVACNMKKNVQCRTTELLMGPTGEIYKCTRDVYVESIS